jgi:hypothetical protein
MKTVLGAAVSLAAIALIGGPSASSQSSACVVQTEKQLRGQARVIFDGIAMRGPTYRGEILTPARFRVLRYWKGHGERVVLVQTRTRKLRHGIYATVFERIDPHRGEHWRIYGRRAQNGVVQTEFCAGSGRLAR